MTGDCLEDAMVGLSLGGRSKQASSPHFKTKKGVKMEQANYAAYPVAVHVSSPRAAGMT